MGFDFLAILATGFDLFLSFSNLRIKYFWFIYYFSLFSDLFFVLIDSAEDRGMDSNCGRIDFEEKIAKSSKYFTWIIFWSFAAISLSFSKIQPCQIILFLFQFIYLTSIFDNLSRSLWMWSVSLRRWMVLIWSWKQGKRRYIFVSLKKYFSRVLICLPFFFIFYFLSS